VSKQVDIAGVRPVTGRGRARAATRSIAYGLAAALLAVPGPVALQAQTSAPTPPEMTTSVGVNLNITPKRLTFDRNSRSATVYIYNQGTTAATFDISVADRVMLPSGEIRAASDIGATPEGKSLLDKLNSGRQLILATPRRATLAPGRGQTIRVRISQPPAGAPAGEFRSHLTVTTIPPRESGLTAEQAASQKPNELSFRVQTVFGLSIPIIIRPGPVDVQARIGDVQLGFVDLSPDGVAPARRTPVLSFEVFRSGANSLFGNIEIRSASPQEKLPLGIARGIGVYPEIDHRTVRVPLHRTPKAGEQLNITFTDDDTKPGSVVARSSFTAT
jgi:P pilus assembly chaperone PapD